ncbi:MAG: hypothetical protein R8K53_01415 [Mariprofundaceae bacterium]
MPWARLNMRETRPDYAVDSANTKLKALTMPVGIRWVAIYSMLVVIGIGPYGIALLFGEPSVAGILVGSVIIFFSLSLTAIMYGLLKLSLWAYKLAKVVYMLLAGFEFIRLVLDLSLENILFQTLSIGIPIWILIYLRRENIRAWFTQ